MEKRTLGEALRERRDRLGIDKAKAAAIVGVARSTYAAYELDSRRLSVDILSALGAFLDASIDELLKLYGATCVAQAREALLVHQLRDDDDLTASAGPLRTREKATHESDMSVVQRVYFDVVTTSGHGVAPPYLAPPSNVAGAQRPTLSEAPVVPHQSTPSASGTTKKDKKKSKSKKSKARSKRKEKKSSGKGGKKSRSKSKKKSKKKT